jgi:pimeloyl-ACP methyl ester carboxylesterase
MLAAVDAVTEGPVDVIGFSIGGWFAQCLAAHERERVRKLVLAHSFVLGPSSRWRFTAALRLWRLLPAALVRAGVMKRARAALEPLKEERPDEYRTVLKATAAALEKAGTLEQLRAQQRLVRDSLGAPLPAVRADMLIIESSADPLVPRKARAQLRRTYPDARTVDFPDGGHVSALHSPSAFAREVGGFLLR